MTIHEERLCSLDTIAARASQPFMHTFTLGKLIRYFIRKYITGIAIHSYIVRIIMQASQFETE